MNKILLKMKALQFTKASWPAIIPVYRHAISLGNARVKLSWRAIKFVLGPVYPLF